MLIVGLSGTIAAGKGTAKEAIEKKFKSVSFSLSDAIRDEARKRGLETNRDNLIAIGNELRKNNGPDILARRISEKSDDAMKRDRQLQAIVIDSIRTPGEIDFLRQKYKDRFILLFTDAPVKLRYERAVARSREGEGRISSQEFKRQDDEGMGFNQPSWGNNLTDCRRISDFIIINRGTKEKMESLVLQVLEEYGDISKGNVPDLVPCMKVKKRDAEKERKKLQKQGLLNLDYSPKTEGDFVFFPVTKRIKGAVQADISLSQRRQTTIEDSLRESGIPSESISKSFDIFGDIALVDVPGRMSRDKERKLAEAVMGANHNIKVVAKKTGPISGEYRVRKLKVIGGENRTSTLHRESGCVFKVDIAKSYFSPRLSFERSRISGLIGPNEDVFVPFAGVGPFSIIIAKQHPKARVWSNELNPDAYSDMIENIKMNKTMNVIPIEGDARKAVPTLSLGGIGLKSNFRRIHLKNRLKRDVHEIEFFIGEGDLENRREEIEESIEFLAKRNIRVMLHEPLPTYKGKRLTLASDDESITLNTLECYKEMYRICRRHKNAIGFIAHGSWVPQAEFNIDKFISNLRRASSYFDCMYLENNMTCTGRIETILQVINKARLRNFCIDLSHMFAVYKDTRKLLDNIRQIKSLCNVYFHINDSDGTNDSMGIGTGKMDFRMLAESGLIDFGTLEVRNRDESKAEEILKSYDTFTSMLPQKRFDRIIMPLPMSSMKFLDMAFSVSKPGCVIHIYMFEKSEGNAVEVVKKKAEKSGKRIKIISTRIARAYSPQIVEAVVDFQVL